MDPLEGGRLIKDEIRQILYELSTRSRRIYSDMLRQQDLHIGQDQLLCQLWENDGLTQSQLSERLNCEPPTVANMVRALENYGLIYRERDASDARINRVFLTEKGHRMKEPIEHIWKEQQDQLLNGLSIEELQLLKSLLNKMVKNLS